MQEREADDQQSNPGGEQAEQGQRAVDAEETELPTAAGQLSGEEAPQRPGGAVIQAREAEVVGDAPRQDDGLEAVEEDQEDHQDGDQGGEDGHAGFSCGSGTPSLHEPSLYFNREAVAVQSPGQAQRRPGSADAPEGYSSNPGGVASPGIPTMMQPLRGWKTVLRPLIPQGALRDPGL